jgi:hypothetical protein
MAVDTITPKGLAHVYTASDLETVGTCPNLSFMLAKACPKRCANSGIKDLDTKKKPVDHFGE